MFSVSVSNLMYEVIPLAQTPIQLLAQIGSLIGTVLFIGKVIMNALESRSRKMRAASKSAASPAEQIPRSKHSEAAQEAVSAGGEDIELQQTSSE